MAIPSSLHRFSEWYLSLASWKRFGLALATSCTGLAVLLDCLLGPTDLSMIFVLFLCLCLSMLGSEEFFLSPYLALALFYVANFGFLFAVVGLRHRVQQRRDKKLTSGILFCLFLYLLVLLVGPRHSGPMM